MTVHSMKPARPAALLLAALLLAVPPASAQVAPVPGGSGKTQDADGAAEAPALPDPLTRQAVRDVLSGLSDGQARELLLRELDRQVAAREAALAAAEAEERVGAALGAREGTGPDDDPLFRSLRRQSRAEGLAEGERKGRADALAKMARRMLLARGVEVSEGFLAEPAFAASSEDAVFDAALTCANEAEFLATLRHSRA